MGDSRSTPVIGKGKVLLKLTSGKVFVLCDVLHVLDIRWNLVLVSLLGKAGVRILFDSDKIVLTKNDAFVGKGYCNQDHGIIHETTPPYSPESNGIAERKNRTLEEMMNAMVVVCETKKFLGSKFDMKDLGEAEIIIGIKITKTPNGLKLSQEHYVEKIIRKFEHFDCKLVSTPYDPSSQLKKNREYSVAQIEYAQIIGSLMYLMNCTIPDIAYAIGRLSWYTQSPNQDHWIDVHRVLKYLRGTVNHGLCFNGFPSVLEGFSDANWILDSNEMKSTSGYVFTLGGSANSWKSAKQTCITRSTMEAEFIALEKADSEAK
ncbi:Retrovirus-related Pol polyprotein from transposon TNT 1-94 [Vitis vinifera]|uniref:Retrovirus-related Pol polyprotein from transposon TNT 1-94 n=1 Tax=Vitis vinifera TaxID=29760 RepID=A0A438E8V3_VITVI|nr:Retrovirus-related Pol polyprotein from transposon TNT 1-94 [Vitis vinifera]